MERDTGSSRAIFVAAIIFLSGISGGLWYFFYKDGVSPFTPRTTNRIINYVDARTGNSGGGQRIPGDINDNGTIDNTDTQMIRDHIGCMSSLPCWGKVIGKTLSGDNPIYASDLDMNSDKSIDVDDVIVVQGKFSK